MASSPARRFISASEFKARCLQLMDEVSATRAELVITKHGAAVARLVPMADSGVSALGFLRGTVRNELSLFDSEVQIGAAVSARRTVARGTSKSTGSTSTVSKTTASKLRSSGTTRSK